VNSLTSGTLRGPGKLALPPLVRAKRDEGESFVFVHVGRGLCGHDGIIHGGLLATLLDETLARTVSTRVLLRILIRVNRDVLGN
jgi:acyl-coenzyme A thioesterase PaaI-like protein